MHITFENNNYTIKINTDNFIFGSGSLECAIKEILSNEWRWYNLLENEKLWYNDGAEYLTCKDVDHVNRIIVFI